MHAWMIALHSDTNPDLLKWVLSLMESLLPDKQVNPVHYASIYDRLQIIQEGRQYFGMFYKVENGERVVYTTIDPENLESRRKSLHLGDTRFRR